MTTENSTTNANSPQKVIKQAPTDFEIRLFQATQSRQILLLTSEIRQQDASPSEENIKIS
jgi:hypothetical protein